RHRYRPWLRRTKHPPLYSPEKLQNESYKPVIPIRQHKRRRKAFDDHFSFYILLQLKTENGTASAKYIFPVFISRYVYAVNITAARLSAAGIFGLPSPTVYVIIKMEICAEAVLPEERYEAQDNRRG
ncbi:MAG: hypothetical protein II072_00165, partial [Clostridia bacterium]|nr:hypothetical protein [Clostridia bacterium]MBQ2111553.1 hypothetical protein [Clostridia bacterium]